MRNENVWTPVVVAALLLAGCEGSESAGGGCAPGTTASIAIAATGVSPTTVCVLPGGSVTFTNDDAIAHEIESGAGCPQLNLGPIPAAESRTATFPAVATCPFHDALNPSAAAFQGTVVVTNAPTPGPGY